MPSPCLVGLGDLLRGCLLLLCDLLQDVVRRWALGFRKFPKGFTGSGLAAFGVKHVELEGFGGAGIIVSFAISSGIKVRIEPRLRGSAIKVKSW